jgi:hypothetical protein
LGVQKQETVKLRGGEKIMKAWLLPVLFPELCFGDGVFGYPCSVLYFKIRRLKASEMTPCRLVVSEVPEEHIAPILAVEVVKEY